MTARSLLVTLLQRMRINKTAHKIYYRYLHGFDAANRSILPALDRCFAKAKECGSSGGGDYMEFGLFKAIVFGTPNIWRQNMALVLCDFSASISFQGLPLPSEIDSTQENVFYEGQYSW